jgi:predicted porin
MNKKVMALAVAGVLAAPAAALAQVQIGGSITIFYYNHDGDNDSVGRTGDIMESSEPEIYVRGEDKLGGGNSAWFQCTSSLDGIIGGTSPASNAGWCGRNSAVGFRGGWGNLFLGNWDQPQKLIFNRGRGWFGGTNAFTGGSAVLLNGGSASGATNAQTTNTFFRRQANSVNYHSPNWGGFSLMGSFSAANESTGNPDSGPLDPRLISLAGQFATGPFYVGLGYEIHQDYNPAGQAVGSAIGQYSGGDDTALTLVAGFRIGGFNIRALYNKSEYELGSTAAAGGTMTLEVDGFGLFADWNISGPHTLRAQVVQVGETSGTSTLPVGSYVQPVGTNCGLSGTASCASDTGGSLAAFFYSYALSKRTELSAGVSSMSNDDNARFSKGKQATTFGGTQTNYGVVIRHRF